MKRILILALLLSLAMVPALAEAPAADAVTSASVADYYADGMLTGDDLMNAINSYTRPAPGRCGPRRACSRRCWPGHTDRSAARRARPRRTGTSGWTC